MSRSDVYNSSLPMVWLLPLMGGRGGGLVPTKISCDIHKNGKPKQIGKPHSCQVHMIDVQRLRMHG